MDSSDFPVSKSPRRELQGPRPAPLKVRKDSYKIKKPPVPPKPSQPLQQQPPAQPRPPVIIYTVSPKVIHTNPSDFMNLVQRLTGSSSSISHHDQQQQINYDHHYHHTGAISPAARYASIEKTKSSSPEKNKQQSQDHNMGFLEGIDMDHNIERSSFFPGILSPGPTSLPIISPSFFSPPSDPNMISFFHDLSPVMHGNKNFIEGSFMPSPSSFISPRITSPTSSVDLFNNFFYY
ncbi:hypothetical protein ACOSP7_009621 [Xanthoceras sorbifolium]|uniref:VQ domain-containing protein n=1 Tax=Xanthoceras sorbifolium TaxID=99658 RepID=A0ABQ8HUS4_9ROSI|nr:hypothetical protein JRO89_XS07G0218600 [Xanthoceras sorbifolium]